MTTPTSSSTFTVTVEGMDLDAWADEYGLERGDGTRDFQEFVCQQIADGLAQHLRNQGYAPTVTCDVQEDAVGKRFFQDLTLSMQQTGERRQR